MEKLIELQTDKLLRKFGAGDHKPGSGSAVALQGMLSAQLIRTVISLTNDEKRRKNYSEWLPELQRIDSDIETRIYPALERLFQQDSEQFDRAIKQRAARDNETDTLRKNQLAELALQELIPATETPVEIAKLCVELADYASFVFDHGFRSARGDSGVALNNAVAAVAGSVSIVNLNLLSFSSNEWTEKIRIDVSMLTSNHQDLSLKATKRLQFLEKEVETSKSYHLEMEAFRSDLWVDSNLSNSDIENIARRLQNALWIYRDKIWKREKPEEPIEVLKPEVVLNKILGYRFYQSTTLGQHEANGEFFEIAGLIDKKQRSVAVSKQFPIQTQNFTAAHEIGHALFHKQTVLHRDKALDGSGSLNSRDIKELQADKFAAYFLMPRKQVENVFFQLFSMEKFVINENTVFALNEGNVSAFKRKCGDLRGLARVIASAEYFSGESFKSLAEIFHVSVETMAIRLEEWIGRLN